MLALSLLLSLFSFAVLRLSLAEVLAFSLFFLVSSTLVLPVSDAF